ncbi:hypothetical protein MF271_04955 [Deinococcus sp. KNUC1210]|uniref:hypothetical protein n=1 Tax=Deinococcus sp. KNUC1210 TaxID=2917691 RepID=UPI001EF09533|nr:hypothetical protein [Deinococcus sp. KNUC1210]ULH15984.1 hypothetical protein MF271_04955 [Deinococcus sp. KNUC1210]
MGGRPGRWNLLNSRVILSTVLLGYGVVFWLRPHLPDLLPGYSRFEDVMPVRDWVIWALVAWAGLLFAPRLSLLQRLVQLATAIYFFLVAGTIAAGVGLTPTVWTTVVEGIAAAAMFGQAQAEAMRKNKLFQHLVAHPPNGSASMSEADIIPVIAKGGIASIILAALYGLSLLINAWRGGAGAAKRETDLATRLGTVEEELKTVKHDMAVLMDQLYGMRSMRDQARGKLYVLELKHAEPVTVWPPDPPPPGGTP